MSEGERLDVLIVKRGLMPSRTRAQAAIAAGLVTVDGARAERPSQRCRADAEIKVEGALHPYVGRGGMKLAHALRSFGLSPAGTVALDIGASTGGFTDCLLQNGAARVYAVDVGTDQLAPGLRSDPRVIALERTNARYLTREQVPEPVGFVTIDVSFISLGKLWPAIVPLLAEDATVVALVKPQFEVGPGLVGRGGIVRSPDAHEKALTAALQAATDAGLTVRGLTHSPVRGGDGNIEFLLYLTRGGHGWPAEDRAALIERAVAAAHGALKSDRCTSAPPGPRPTSARSGRH